MPIWNPEYECMSREELRALQLRRLQATVAWVYDRVPYYREQLEARGVHPKDVRSLDDVRLLPFTDKTALRDTYPFGMFAVPLDEVVRVHSSSGTTGKPIVVGYTRGDLNTWTELTARIASAAGVTAKDRVQMAFLYSMFTGGWGMHYGIERIGATIFPAGAGNTERHLMMMQDFGTTALVCTPSYALYIAEVAEQTGVDIKSLPLRVGLFGGEPSGEGMREEIERRLGILATDNYGLSEVMGPGVSGECEHQCGLHMAEDHFLFEIVDPETGEPLDEGEEGELVITTLTKEAFPVLRYRTHDLTTIDTSPCVCGRTSARMRKVRARTDDMLIIRGVNVFPSQIEDALMQIEGVEPHYLIVVNRDGPMDDLEVRIEVAEAIFSDAMADLVGFTRRVAEKIYSVVGLHAKVTLVEPGTIERTAGKARRVIDNRRAE
ncbi:phenylacetate--CoA ligase [Coriobacteriia bacterium Es71-Z0120]|jgi:phenylacetate-CoA ligase|uniref:phenylacetate--CoA ligase family protein n=1 Tax=Parvivirga hydrogeniphila TaxID=2939460 RepID=UPI002260E3F4|nr:phenylacetate--CoA ligase [Parvivirga hydrogeniphila]MCL4079645.1 phenylacetate--CoA ligase [Parvivirga hydrogeniphila]